MKKAMLIILDGWGIAEDKADSAMDNAGSLYFHQLENSNPHSTLITFGKDVGLPQGQMGNSEVGHLNIGAGRIVYQEFQRINNSIETQELKENQNLKKLFEYCKKNQKPLHLMGLYSDGGVHSHSSHFKAIYNYALEFGLSEIYIHAFMDGRDCDPNSGVPLLEDLYRDIETKSVKLASVIGRYYAMDRDKRWERVKIAYDALTKGIGEHSDDVISLMKKKYEKGETDEFIKPIISSDFKPIEDGDGVLCLNFRTDRCRELTEVLTQRAFPEFDMKPLKLHYVTMTEYSKDFKEVDALFYQNDLNNTLGAVLTQNNKSQIRAAETEKYPHVTFFFSGGREVEFSNEKRILVPSPKVATYDMQPEMSAFLLKDQLIEEIKQNPADFVVINFANTDMVGHTGSFDAAIKAVQAVDSCLQELIPFAQNKDYDILIIADHGNSDKMRNPDGSPNTAHTTNLVPCVLIAKEQNYKLKDGILADVAPTILDLMNIEQPAEMTGHSLLIKN